MVDEDHRFVFDHLNGLKSEIKSLPIEENLLNHDFKRSLDEYMEKAMNIDKWTETDWEKLLHQICIPIFVSDSLTDSFHKFSIQKAVQIVEAIEKKIEIIHIGHLLSQLFQFLLGENSASDEQIKQKVKAADSILSSKLDFLSLKIVIQDLEKLILAVNSSQWERISVKRWILKLVPKALKADKGFIHTLVDSCVDTTGHIEWLCAASNFLFEEGNENFFLILVKGNFFWKVIAHGLVDRENYFRKRSLYLLKRSTDKMASGAFDKFDSDISDPMVLTNSSSFKNSKLWATYFLIVETLDEKQVHIVKQVLGSIEDLLNHTPVKGSISCEKSLHLTWILVLYRILFNHQNNVIVIWSVENFMKTFYVSQISFDQDILIEFVCEPFIDALNLTKMFEDSGPENCIIASKLDEFLSKFTKLHSDFACKFWCQFLSNSFKKLLGPVPIYYITRSVFKTLSHAKDIVLDNESLQMLQEFCEVQLKCQDPMIRGYVQACFLRLGMNCWEKPKLQEKFNMENVHRVTEFLATFHGTKKVLIRGTTLWEEAGRWLCNFLQINLTKEADNLIEFLVSSSNGKISPSKIGLLAILLYDFVSDGNEAQNKLILNLLDEIKDQIYRTYAAPITFQLSLLASIFRSRNTLVLNGKDLENSSKISDKNESWIVKAIVDYMAGLDPLNDQRELEDAVSVLLEVQLTKSSVEMLSKHLWILIPNSLLQSSREETKKKIVSVILVSSFSKQILNDKSLVEPVMEATIKGIFPTNLMEEMTGQMENREGQRIWGELISQATYGQWKMIESCLDFIAQKPILAINDFLLAVFHQASYWLNIGGISILQPLLSAAKKALSFMEESVFMNLVEDVRKFIDQCEKTVFETRKSDLFWKTFDSLVEFVFSPLIIKGLPNRTLQLAIRIFKEAETVQGMTDIFSKNFIMIVENGLKIGEISEDLLALVLVETCCYGPIYKRDQRVISRINAAIEAEGIQQPVNLYEVSDHLDQSRVRTKGFHLLLVASLSKDFPRMRVLEEISKKFEPLEKGNSPRCFENSALHLRLTRAFQFLLVVAKVLCKSGHSEGVDSVAKMCLQSFVSENQRPSIKYLAEWILAILSINFPSILNPILEKAFDQAKANRLSCAPAFFSITVQQALHLGDRCSLEVAISKLMPWTMGQHFGTRLEAQLGCQRLYKELEKSTHESPFKIFAESIEASFKTGDVAKNLEKINSNFFSSTFDPNSCTNLENIFYDLPRLCKLDPAECIPLELLKSMDCEQNTFIPLLQSESPWSTHKNEETNSTCYCKSCIPIFEQIRERFEIHNGSEGDTIQKKITPWKEMLETDDFFENRVAAHPNLILVGSLVDRPPNLGGLCRTSEILGVGQYVVGNSAITADKEFQSLSVTAQNWLDIVEVRPNDLLEFFKQKKDEGYRIVGIEQTPDSISLEKYNFEKKTVLVLGNEKEGIPMHLIQEMDDCIEIPQTGVVRSLNVHVSGALVVWEYVRQATIQLK